MTLSFSKAGAISVAATFTALTLGSALTPAAADARNSGPHYRAELVQPTDKTVEIVRGTPWQCSGTVCVAPKAGSRPVNVCKAFARKVGEVASFTVAGEPLAADKMAKCQGD
ncbi:hypothetical protein PF049_00300 [Erythrobacteraceae bacterium WH01K]|nr:hypothetical protein PF049_00300 [Erythrobacteraceae bacterium WH01K]